MPRDNGVPRKSSPEVLGQRHAAQYRPRLPLLVVVASLTLVSLACAFIGTNAPDRVVVRTRLPTFTRTRLPTLTTTAISTPAAAAMVAESAEAAPTVASVESAVGSEAAAAISSHPPASSSAPAEVSEPDQASGSADTLAVDPTLVQAEVPTTSPIDTSASPSAAAAIETPLPTSTPTATATEIPPTSTPIATPTATPLPEEWLFTGLRVSPDQSQGNLLVYGDLINNTGSTQEIAGISGIFYDAQGQIIADKERTLDYWPLVDTIFPDGRMPFKLTVVGIQNAADFDLGVEAKPIDETPSQDFEFFDVNQSNQTADFCLTGKLQNPGGQLKTSLTIFAVLYDGQDNVVNFGDYYQPYLVGGDQALDFEICIDSLNQEVARYELNAWEQ